MTVCMCCKYKTTYCCVPLVLLRVFLGRLSILLNQIRAETVLAVYVVFLAHGFRVVVCPQASNKTQIIWVFNWVRVWLSAPRDLWCCWPPDHHDTDTNITWVNGFQRHWATHILKFHLEAGNVLSCSASLQLVMFLPALTYERPLKSIHSTT